jgi:DNA-binding PadR family transcriptional regulator
MTAIATTHWAGHPRHHEPRAGKHRAGKKRHAGKVLLGAALMRAMSEGRHGRHGGHRGYGPGHGWTGPGPFGPGGFGPFGRGGRGKRARRGDVRAAVLLLLEEEPRNGYQLMQEIEERSGGVWRPSPGSVYPALQLLADEGLIRSEARDGGNIFELTDAGKAHVEEHRERFGSPWQQAGEGVPEGMRELGGMLGQVAEAVRQVMQAGTEEQVASAAKLLADTRRSLYRVLAGDETPPAT